MTTTPFTLDAAHPDSARWQRAIDTAVLRGGFVCSALAAVLPLADARVLDLGCGVGGTSRALRRHRARVVAADIDPRRLAALDRAEPGIPRIGLDGDWLPFRTGSFDAVVLQDMLEHVPDPASVLAGVARVLAPGGVAYISTPNRWALVNLPADPHWSLPLAAVLPRPALRRMLRLFRPADAGRHDLAQLLSRRTLLRFLRDTGLEPRFMLRHAATRLFAQPGELAWSRGHLALIRLVQRLGLAGAVPRLMPDVPGLLSDLLVPAWYLIARKPAA